MLKGESPVLSPVDKLSVADSRFVRTKTSIEAVTHERGTKLLPMARWPSSLRKYLMGSQYCADISEGCPDVLLVPKAMLLEFMEDLVSMKLTEKEAKMQVGSHPFFLQSLERWLVVDREILVPGVLMQRARSFIHQSTDLCRCFMM